MNKKVNLLKKYYKNQKNVMKPLITVSPLILMILIILFNYIFSETDTSLMSLSSGSPGGAYYPLGGGIAEVISANITGTRMDSESTSGSVENIRLVGRGKSDLGMAMESSAYKGMKGLYPFSSEYDIRALFNMYIAPLHIVTLEGSGIESIYDLEGKRVSIDSPGSGAEEMARTILEDLGLMDSVTALNYGQTDAANALADGNIDAVFWNFAYPGSAVMEVSSVRDIRLIPLSEEDMDKIIENNPYFSKDIIPEGTYDNQNEDVDVLSVNNLIVVHKEMDETLVYDILDSIFSNTERLEEIHSVAQQINLENAIDTSIELHPGAKKFFEEAGNGEKDD